MRRIFVILTLLTAFASGTVLAAEKPSMDNSTVSVPWPEFKSILDRLEPDTTRDTIPPALPADYVVTQATFTGASGGTDQFAFSAAVTVSVLKPDSWVAVNLGSIPLLQPGMTVNKRAARVGRNSSGRCVVMLNGSGTYTVAYEFLVPLSDNAGSSSLSFGMPGQTASRVSLTLDRAGLVVTANGMRLVERGTAKKGGHVYSGSLGSNARASIAWQQEMSHISASNAMLLGSFNTLYSIGEGIVQTRSEVSVTAVHQEIRQFALVVPAGVEVIDLSGPALAAWETSDSAGSRYVRAHLKYGMQDKGTFALSLEMAYPDTQTELSLPSIMLDKANRQEGTAAIGALGNVEIRHADHSGNVLRRDKRELGSWFNDKGDILHVYQYLSGPYRIDVNLTHHGNVSALDALGSTATVRSVMREDGKTITQWEATVRNRGEQFLRLSWDPAWQLWSLYCNDEPARPAYDSTTGELLVPLEKSTEKTANTKVRLVYLAKHGSFWPVGRQKVVYPKLNMPLQRVTGTVYVPEEVVPFGRSGTLHERSTDHRVPWFESFFGMNMLKHVVAGFQSGSGRNDYYEKPAEELEAIPPPAPARDEERIHMERKKLRARVTRKGVLGKELSGVGGLRGGDGGGRAGVAGIGYGARSDVDDLMADVVGASNVEVQQLSQQLAMPTVTEAGLLSIAVDISFEGRPERFSSAMLGTADSPWYAFFYRTASRSVNWLRKLLTFLLTLTAGLSLARCFMKGWTFRRFWMGVMGTLALAVVINQFFGRSVAFDLVYVVPILWVGVAFLISMVRTAHERVTGHLELVRSMKTLKRKGKKAAAEAADTTDGAAATDAPEGPTPPPIPGSESEDTK